MSNHDNRAVLVTTAHRGVFFGYASGDMTGKTVVLSKARNCIYWPPKNKGFLGLATDGPLDGAKVGPAADDLTLHDVTSVVGCSQAAVARWEKQPWS